MTPKPLAALTSTLLARKGQAKPAMRPQGYGSFGHRQEDLGWNDMGIDALRPEIEPDAEQTQPSPPVVVQQQQDLVQHFTPKFASETQVQVGVRGKKAAFTLRLDEERHLRLRLASAVASRSSQQLVTEAVDLLLAGVPDLEALVAKAKRSAGK